MKKCYILFLIFALAPGIVFAGGGTETTEETGGTVSFLMVGGAPELEAIAMMLAPFEADTGIDVEVESTRDIDAILTTRVEAGNPPDIVALPGPGHMITYGQEGKLVDLSDILDMGQIKTDFAQGWLDLGTVDGNLVGIFYKSAIKGLIWYNTSVVESNNISLPDTWEELLEVSNVIKEKGLSPFSIGIESGAASGWIGTDWIENIFLRLHGPDKYQEWQDGELAWTSAEVKEAWEMFGQIVGDDSMIYGGKNYVLSTNFGDGHAPLFSDPPKAVFHHQASFIQGFIQDAFPNLTAGEDFSFFGFPSINPKYSNSIEAGGDVLVAFNNTAQVAALLNYLASADAQKYWAETGAGLAPNRNVSISAYQDELSKAAASIQANAEIVVFDAGDMMPSEVNNAFFAAVVEFVQNPNNLDSILENLDRIRVEAFGR